MEKKSFLKKIDELYTKATKAIIGDIPHDGDDQSTPSSKKSSNPTTEVVGFKNKLLSVKDKFLNLGAPDKKSLLYKEVVKREKQEAKDIAKSTKEATKTKKTVTKKTVIKKASPKKKTAGTKKSSSETAKKTPSKKVTVKKTVEKKKPAKKTTTTKKTSSVSKAETSNKKAPTKKSATQKDTSVTKKAVTKKASAKKVPSKSKTETTKKTPVKKVTVKKTAEKKIPSKKKTADVSKVEANTKKTPTKKVSTTKTNTEPKGTKKAAKIALYIKDIKKHYGEVDEAFVAIIVKNLGPSIYKRDAELVSCSDPKELDTVRKNFLMKKLGIDASKGVLDAAIQDVCEELKATRTKYRATFYYALAKKFKKESVLS